MKYFSKIVAKAKSFKPIFLGIKEEIIDLCNQSGISTWRSVEYTFSGFSHMEVEVTSVKQLVEFLLRMPHKFHIKNIETTKQNDAVSLSIMRYEGVKVQNPEANDLYRDVLETIMRSSGVSIVPKYGTKPKIDTFYSTANYTFYSGTKAVMIINDVCSGTFKSEEENECKEEIVIKDSSGKQFTLRHDHAHYLSAVIMMITLLELKRSKQ